MEKKKNTNLTFNLSARLNNLLIFLIFVILLIFLSACGGFQSIHAQEQWKIFSMQNSGLPGGARCIVVDRNNVKWIGTNNGLARLEGNNWTVYDTSNSPIPFASIFKIAVDSLNNVWLGSFSGGGLVKFDGINWSIYTTTNSGLPYNTASSIGVDKDNIKWIGTSNNKMSKFNDTSWIVYDLSYFGFPYNAVLTTAMENHIKWFGTNSAGIAMYNDTNSVVYNYSNSGIPSNDIRSISIDTSGNKWIATQFGGVAMFNSNLNQWTVYNTTNSPLPENHVWTIYADKKNTIWIGCNSAGVARYDGNWTLFNTSNSPLPSNSISYFAEDKFDNIWICCGYLVIYNENGIIGINSQIKNSPSYFKLYQNYPNPFNPVTNIKYEIEKSSYIKLAVLDMLGKEIKVLVEGYQKPGVYNVSFDGSKYASGIYLYRIEAGNYKQARKMVLVK